VSICGFSNALNSLGTSVGLWHTGGVSMDNHSKILS
jgi:hypothetical protein